MHNVLFSIRSLALTSALFLTGNLLSAQNNDKTFDTAKSISVFNSVLKELNTLYVDTFDLDNMVEKGINTMLYTLDPYTTYIPETETEDFKFMTTGEYGGIGSLITYRDSFTYIAEPYEGLPAQVCGLKAGDKILRVDSVSAVGLPSDKVSERLKGPANTIVRVVVERPETLDTLTFDIVRKKITLPAVPYYGVRDGGVGYIYLQSFTDKAAAEVKEAFIDLKRTATSPRSYSTCGATPAVFSTRRCKSSTTSCPKAPRYSRPAAASASGTRPTRPPRNLSTRKYRWSFSSTVSRPRPRKSWPVRCKTSTAPSSWANAPSEKVSCRPPAPCPTTA